MSAQRIALVCMTPEPDTNELGHLDLPSYGIRRILAAVVSDPGLKSAKVALVDYRRADVEAYVDALVAFEPDLIGFSIYVWSAPCMIVCVRLRRSLLSYPSQNVASRWHDRRCPISPSPMSRYISAYLQRVTLKT